MDILFVFFSKGDPEMTLTLQKWNGILLEEALVTKRIYEWKLKMTCVSVTMTEGSISIC